MTGVGENSMIVDDSHLGPLSNYHPFYDDDGVRTVCNSPRLSKALYEKVNKCTLASSIVNNLHFLLLNFFRCAFSR